MSDYIKKMPRKFKDGAEYDFDTRKPKGEDSSEYIKKMPRNFENGAEYDFDNRKIKGGKTAEMIKAGESKKYAKGGMPDLTGDGKVTRADVLKGRGVFKKGGSVPKGMHRMPDGTVMKDSEHKKAKKPKKMMGGGTMKYAHGGSVDGCAVRGKTKGRMV